MSIRFEIVADAKLGILLLTPLIMPSRFSIEQCEKIPFAKLTLTWDAHKKVPSEYLIRFTASDVHNPIKNSA